MGSTAGDVCLAKLLLLLLPSLLAIRSTLSWVLDLYPTTEQNRKGNSRPKAPPLEHNAISFIPVAMDGRLSDGHTLLHS